jgi:hypothetical protein
MSADNQQERLDEQWIVGFVDGEGCFHVSINRNKKMTLGLQVLPEFRVVQHQKDEQILHKLQNYFGFGGVVKNHGDRKEFRVRGSQNLDKIIKFFKENKLRTIKLNDFNLFCEIINLMKKDQHLTMEGVLKISKIASKMNRKIDRTSRILRDYTPNTSSTKLM